MWGTAVKIAISALASWVASDWWNTNKAIEATEGKSDYVKAAGEAAKANWIKWIAITVIAATVSWVIIKVVNLVVKNRKLKIS